ncbi:V-type ATP synthase subunit K [Patescibacteria group bacterium]|nr:V-type ATP synthase subunit K [Patescibacteria group bacterium]MBU1123071.1 V-type ATP synthase subunit K [Patescibacteria group bacterium]
MKTRSLLTAAALLAPIAVFAQEPEAIAAATHAGEVQWGLAFALFGAAIATFVSCIGSIIGVSVTGQAGAGLLTEKPELAGKVITLMVLPGSQGLYGMVIALLFIFNYADVINGEVAISVSQGVAILAACLPVAFTCVTSGPYQAKVCAAGMHMLAKDEKMTGRVITMAALVETYALLGFLISFFMLNNFKGGIL